MHQINYRQWTWIFKNANQEKSMSENLGSTIMRDEIARAVERVYFEWDRAWSNDDLDAMIELYAPDAVLESPLIPYLQGGGNGVLKGREEIRKLLDKAAPRKSSASPSHCAKPASGVLQLPSSALRNARSIVAASAVARWSIASTRSRTVLSSSRASIAIMAHRSNPVGATILAWFPSRMCGRRWSP
jgi:hypothetical protein